MKYLKKFESAGLKEYVIWDLASVLIILKVKKDYYNSVEFERLYIYNSIYDNIRETSHEIYTFDYDKIKKHVVYDSNNLDDCLDLELLSALKNSKMYNI